LIEQAMIFALGFFVAGLLALLFLPAVQRRAARLSARRMEMQLPLSMEEIVAERDQLRAEFAVERRRIEQKVEAVSEAAAEHMAEIGRHTVTIHDLNQQLTAARGELRAASEAKDALQRDMAEAEAKLAATLEAVEGETGAHGATRESLARLHDQHAALEHLTNEQRASLAGLETRAAALDLRIVALHHQKDELERNLQSKTSEAEVLLVERDLARAERDGLETKRATLQRRLDEEAMRAADLRDQIEALRRRVDEADRARVAGAQTRDSAEQRHAEAARQLQEHENRIRALQSAAAERHAAQVAEIATLTGQLETARREHANLRDERRPREREAPQKLEVEAEAQWKSRYEKQAAEIAALAAALEEARQQHDGATGGAGATGTAAGLADAATGERDETALLRQAIADLGSEVVRIAGSLKDSDRPDAGSIPPDVIGVREHRSRARAQS
jgi:chromosome segregation ATPase